MNSPVMPPLVSTGAWGNDLPWELYVSDQLPPLELCSAVMCVPFMNEDVVLARTRRGWGMLGGHIERGESFEDALIRELAEEGGYVPSSFKPFAYRKLLPSKPLPHQREGEFYPFPIGYIVYYKAQTNSDITGPTEQDVFEARVFSMAEVEQLETTDKEVIRLAAAMP